MKMTAFDWVNKNEAIVQIELNNGTLLSGLIEVDEE